MPDNEPQWITTGEAAKGLGIGARAVQRRAERGTLTARQVEHGRAMRWEIDARDIGSQPFAKGSSDVREQANIEHEEVRQTFANRSPDVRTNNDDFNTHLIEENKFLRAVVEQLQRDGAETRAALREALKLAPKELPMEAASSATDGAPESGDSGAPKRATAQDSPKGESGPQRPADAPESALTYGDIADQLERMNR